MTIAPNRLEIFSRARMDGMAIKQTRCRPRERGDNSKQRFTLRQQRKLPADRNVLRGLVLGENISPPEQGGKGWKADPHESQETRGSSRLFPSSGGNRVECAGR